MQEGSEFWHKLEDVAKVDEWKIDYCTKYHEQDRVEVFNLENYHDVDDDGDGDDYDYGPYITFFTVTSSYHQIIK